MNIKLDNYEIDILVQGFPGRSVYHAGLGWSSIALVRSQGRVLVIDTGSMFVRGLLVNELAKSGVKPADVTDLLVTHAHHDHIINWTLFPNARIGIGAQELAWAPVCLGELRYPNCTCRNCRNGPSSRRSMRAMKYFPAITAHIGAGHTPGGLVYALHGNQHDVIFTGDAGKNRVELVARKADVTYDPAVSLAAINMIWDMWRRLPGTIIVPGHDIAMVQEDGKVRYIDERRAAITAWYGDDLQDLTRFELNCK